MWCLLLGCRLSGTLAWRAAGAHGSNGGTDSSCPWHNHHPKALGGGECTLPTSCVELGRVFHSFSHSTSILLSTYTIPGAGNTTVNKTGQTPLPRSRRPRACTTHRFVSGLGNRARTQPADPAEIRLVTQEHQELLPRGSHLGRPVCTLFSQLLDLPCGHPVPGEVPTTQSRLDTQSDPLFLSEVPAFSYRWT